MAPPQIYNCNGAPVDERNRLRGSFQDKDGVRHAVNAMVIYLNGQRENPICDSWETQCTDYWWQEDAPKMIGKKVTCVVCLGDLSRKYDE